MIYYPMNFIKDLRRGGDHTKKVKAIKGDALGGEIIIQFVYIMRNYSAVDK